MARIVPEVSVITLYEDDLGAAKGFYQKVFGLEALFEDHDAVGFKLDGVILRLLRRSAARESMAPGPVADREAGARSQLTVFVEDVDGRCARLRSLGVKLLNGPVDRPWGMRTAAFTDPSGHIWEVAQALS